MPPSVALFPSLEQTVAHGAPTEPAGAVLLVEDDESLSDLLKHLMSRMKVRALHASTGAAALKMLVENRTIVTLAFVDCHLPDSEGGELCKQLRALAPRLPLLLTSGRDQSELESVFAPAGPCSFLAKPYMPGDVMARVKAMLATAR